MENEDNSTKSTLLTDEDLKNENLNSRAQYHELSGDKEEIVKLLRWTFSEIYNCLDTLLDTNRESSLAYTKLEEAQMWAIKSITHNKLKISKEDINEIKK